MNDGSGSARAVKVMFVLGWGRSGSTLLDNILGQIDGFFSAGEMHYVWDHVQLARPCGCGRPIMECPVWSEVVARTLDPTLQPGDIFRWQQETMRLRHTIRVLRWKPGRTLSPPDLDSYAGVTGRLYREIGNVTGARVVVDSTKRPPDAALLRVLDDVDGYIVHLVRDPRAVAYSWQRRRPQLDRPTDMDRYSSAGSAVNWMAWNLAAEAMQRRFGRDRVITIRYEDFIAKPRATIERIVRFGGESPVPLPFVDESTVELASTHTVAGNPGRFRTGRVSIREDDEWRRKQSLSDRAVSTALCAPLLHRYGYGFTTSQDTRGSTDPAQT